MGVAAAAGHEPECGEIGGVFDGGHCHAGDEPEPNVAPGSFFVSPGGEGVDEGYTCAGGAEQTGGRIFGQVTWKNIRRQDNHIHRDITLSGLNDATNGAPGFLANRTYQIVGNQDALCDPNTTNGPIVDFHLRHGHTTFRFIDGSGASEATIGLTFGSELQLSEGHEAGTHQLWLTIRGPGVLWDPNADPPHTVLVMCIMMTLEICLKGRVIQRAVRPLPLCTNILDPALVLRSTAVVVVVKKHSGHP